MRDGITLSADRYYAPSSPHAPLVLIRTPYGRGAIFGIMAGLLAERGLQVLLQSVRGTAGSQGDFDPMRQERADGTDSIDWIKAQPWFGGKLFTFGISYLGNVQWAMAMDRADAINGMGLGVTLSNFRDEFFGNGAFTQSGLLSWTQTMLDVVGIDNNQIKRRRPPPLDAFHSHLPVGEMDELAFGKSVPWWREFTTHSDPDDPWWDTMNYSPAVVQVDAPTLMTAGWNDIFLPYHMRDFEARQAAGKPAFITIGPWQHASPGGVAACIREAVTQFPALAAGRNAYPDRKAVRLYVNGANTWRDYSSWPPPDAQPQRLYLHAGGKLGNETPTNQSGATAFVYDPADPTPSIHGPALMGGAKIRDMSALEMRSDTISFSGPVLGADIEVIGPVSAELSVRSDRAHTDFYACLCDVDLKGRAAQVCDGLVRLRPGKADADANGIRHIVIQCWPTAWRFKKGHSLRLIVASGAHPRYGRNPGTGDPLASATQLVAAQQEVLHSASAQSALVLSCMPID